MPYHAGMCPIPSSSSPAPRAASAPPPPASGRGRLPPGARAHARSTGSRSSAAELGGDERALAVRCDVTEWEQQQAMVRARARALRPPRRGVRQCRLRRRARILERVPRALALDGADERLRRGADDPRDAAGRSSESRGHFLLTGSVAGRRALPGSLYSATKWAVTAMGEALRQELNDTGVRVTLIEPGMVDTPFFDDAPVGRAAAGRRRPGGDVRRLPAAARRRQRDPGQADRAGQLTQAAPRAQRRARSRATTVPAS